MILMILFGFSVFGQAPTLLSGAQWGPVHLDTCYTSGKAEEVHIGMSPFWRQVGAQGGKMTAVQAEQFEKMKTATIVIEFGAGFDQLGTDAQAARDAFRFAADIWETEVVSVVPILIAADFASLPGGVLGQNGSPSVTGVPNAPDQSINYTLALANAIAGFDLDPGTPNGNQTYNLNFDFYFETDGNTPAGITDFTTVVLHEIGHSMGISGISNGGAGVGANGGANPRSWDLLVELGDGTPILDLGYGTSAQQAALVGGDLFINGPLSVAALGGQRPEIYAPGSFSPGSSYSHWDEATFPPGDVNSLMTPFLGSGETNFDIGDITRGVLSDQGWVLSSELETQDVGVIEVSAPSSDSDLGAAEPIVVTVRNFGIEDAAGFNVSYQVDGGPVVTEAFPDTLPAISVATFTFSQTADFSADSTTYSLTVATDLAGDQATSNDTTVSLISNLVPSFGVVNASLDFGDLGVGNQVTQSSVIFNSATGDLAGEVDILSITIDGGNFSADQLATLPLTVLPGDSLGLLFTYAPTTFGADSSVAFVTTNAGDFVVSLFGTGVEPSDINVTPDSLVSVLELGGFESQTLFISNSGASDLTFDLQFVSEPSESEEVAAPFLGGLRSLASVSSPLKSGKAEGQITRSQTKSVNEASILAENAVYQLDDGSSENAVGINTPNELMWLNAFQVAAGANIITSISSAVASGPPETPARFILYDDPDNDGDPSNAVFLTEASGILTNPEEDVFSTVQIEPTEVRGVFFVAVLIEEDPSVNAFPMPVDQSSGTQQASWAVSNIGFGTFDLFNLANNSLPPLLIDEAGLPGNWLLRADGQNFSASPVSGTVARGETLEVQVDFFGGSPGLFSSTIAIESNDPDEPVVNVPISLEVEGVLVSVSPDSLVESLLQGRTSTQTLTLTNEGANDVTFDIEVENLGLIPPTLAEISERGFNPVNKRTEAYTGEIYDGTDPSAIVLGQNVKANTVQYETGFEGFIPGDINGQQGWAGQFANWTIESVNPSEGTLHFRGLSDGLGQSIAFSPLVEIGVEPISSVRLDLEVVGTGTTWDIIPQSPTGASVNTRLRFNPDGSLSVLVNDPTLGVIFVPINATVPTGYFNLRIEVERSTSQFAIYFDDALIFEGAGFAGDIEQLVVFSLMETNGPTLDVDNVAIIDGTSEGGGTSILTPSVTSGVIPGNGTFDVEVTFDANLDFGTYRSNLIIGLNDNPDIEPLVVGAQLTVEGPPSIDVNPTVIIEELDFRASSTRILTLNNTGGETLEYDLSIIGATVDEMQRGLNLQSNEGQLMDAATLQKKARDDEQSALRSRQVTEPETIFNVIGDVVLEESFEGGVFPPEGWQAIDNEGAGVNWGFISDVGEANYTSTGEAATVSSDEFGVAEFDAELRTPEIDITDKSGLFIQYSVNYQNFAAQDFLDVDVSTDGGTTWTTVLSWNEDHGGFRSFPGELVTLDLDDFVSGAERMMLRWRYYDPNTGDFDWYAQIDDVVIFEEAEMWLSVDQSSGQIPVGGTAEVEVNFDASLLQGGDFIVAGIVVNSNAINAPEIGVVAAIDVRNPAEAQISVDSLTEFLVEGTSATQTFTIRNSGESLLTFDFEDIFFESDEVFFTGEVNQHPDRKEFVAIDQALQASPVAISRVSSGKFEKISTNQYTTDFEDFLTGDITGQSGWFGQFGNWTISDSNPFGKSQHFSSLSDGLGATLAFSPQVAIGTEPFSSTSMLVNLQGDSVTWDIIPQSPSAGFVNTILRFNADGSVSVLEPDELGQGVFVPVAVTVPAGYFKVSITANRSTSEVQIFFDGVEVYSGLGFAGDIEQVVFRSLMEVEGPTFDVDNIQITDGEFLNPFISFTPGSPRSGALTTGSSAEISVLFDARNELPGILTENILLSTNDPEKEKVTIPATLNVLQVPTIQLASASVEFFAVVTGERSESTFTISNDGDVPLVFSAQMTSEGLFFANGSSVLEDTVPGKGSVTYELVAMYDSAGVFGEEIEITSNDPDDLLVLLPVSVTVFPAAGGITGFNIIDAEKDVAIGELSEAGQIDVGNGMGAFTIEALALPQEVGSVVFEIDGKVVGHENRVPYSASGDSRGDFLPLNLDGGKHTITAIPYSRESGRGEPGHPLTVSFEVVNSDQAVSFDLINTRDGSAIGSLTDGAIIDLASDSTKAFSVEAFANPEVVSSMVFQLNGRIIQKVEGPRYVATRKDRGRYKKLHIGKGDFTLTATPYSLERGRGVAGKPLEVSFTVIDSNDMEEDLSAFPNPIVGTGLTIELPMVTDADVFVEITDMEGKVMYSEVKESVQERSFVLLEEVSESYFNAGVYLIKVKCDEMEETIRLMKR